MLVVLSIGIPTYLDWRFEECSFNNEEVLYIGCQDNSKILPYKKLKTLYFYLLKLIL